VPFPFLPEEIPEAQKGHSWRATLSLELLQASLEALVELEPQAEQREHPVGIVGLGSQLRIPHPSRLAGGLQRSPAVCLRQQPLEEVSAAEFAGEVRAPPAEPRLL